jgi:starvation-inducible DNA-binding protein
MFILVYIDINAMSVGEINMEHNEDLIYQLKVALATSFTFYMKAHNYHINVECKNFSEVHKFFGKIYEEVHGYTDSIAELIRTCGSYSPFSYSRFLELSKTVEETTVPPVDLMFENLCSDNEILLATLYTARKAAEDIGNYGITNHLEDMITATQKRHWMLNSFKM